MKFEEINEFLEIILLFCFCWGLLIVVVAKVLSQLTDGWIDG